jgi:hypothetical protein
MIPAGLLTEQHVCPIYPGNQASKHPFKKKLFFWHPLFLAALLSAWLKFKQRGGGVRVPLCCYCSHAADVDLVREHVGWQSEALFCSNIIERCWMQFFLLTLPLFRPQPNIYSG